VDVGSAAGQEQIVVLIDHAWLGRNLCPEIIGGIHSCIARHFLPASPEGSAHLGAWLNRVIDGFWCDAETAGAKLRAPAVVHALDQDLLLRLGAALRVRMPAIARPPAWLRHQALRRLLDYLRAAEPATFSIAKLCAVAGASQRTLEYAFREAFQMTPAAFLQLWRLGNARTALLAASPTDTSVTHIAVRVGFYQRLFGEPPSETLKRHCPPIPRNLAWT
jgi:AraC-like DNA-binding protein